MDNSISQIPLIKVLLLKSWLKRAQIKEKNVPDAQEIIETNESLSKDKEISHLSAIATIDAPI